MHRCQLWASSSPSPTTIGHYNLHLTTSSAEDALLDITSNDASRLLYLFSVTVSTRKTFASGLQVLQSANYVVRVCLGKAPQPMLMALETSNDATWLPCPACAGCPPSSAIFDSTKSSSFTTVPNPSCQGTNCSFNMTYGSSTFQAALSHDTLHIADDIFPAYTFGCLQKVIGSSVSPQGLLGLGWGPASLLSQTQDKYRSTFSYCLPNFRSLNFSGSLRLGPARQPIRIKTTLLLTNPCHPTFYYVNMTGIQVDRREVAIPPSALAFDPTTGAGTIFDSGTMFIGLVVREGGVLLGGGEHAREEDVLHAIIQDLQRRARAVRLRAQWVRHQEQHSLLLPPGRIIDPKRKYINEVEIGDESLGGEGNGPLRQLLLPVQTPHLDDCRPILCGWQRRFC
ncbi:hypothetical protein Taro_045147 [Colocasia esculenta]|uniref:Peptidase A1 domain-containing protein n=1 Tax=Colocasia esculenta TaxID=4460 RepID=A0A843WNP7_COLES|nr:hypothetical protein [Colocasia esculenta]